MWTLSPSAWATISTRISGWPMLPPFLGQLSAWLQCHLANRGGRGDQTRTCSLTGDVVLRDVMEDDLPIFFEHQQDPEASRMAAFTPRDRDAFYRHWRTKILSEETVAARTVLYQGEVAGNIMSFEHLGKREIGYWIGREF